MKRKDQFIQAVVRVIRNRGYKLGDMEGQKPKDFWSSVKAELPKDMTWSENHVYYLNEWNRRKKEIMDILKSDTEPISDGSQILSSQNEQIRSNEKISISSKQVAYLSDEDIVKLVNEVLDKRISDIKQVVNIEMNKMETPPETTTIKGSGKGRKETRKYQKISPTIDVEIYKLLMSDCAKRKISVGKYLDQILWHWFGKPKLSYED